MSEGHRRFADAKLQEFYQDFEVLKKEFEDDKNDREAMKATLENNTEVIKEMHTSTVSLLEAWNNALGFLRVIAAISRMVKILAPILALFGGLWYFLHNGTWPHK